MYTFIKFAKSILYESNNNYIGVKIVLEYKLANVKTGTIHVFINKSSGVLSV